MSARRDRDGPAAPSRTSAAPQTKTSRGDADLVVVNVTLATMQPGAGPVADGALTLENGFITWIGPRAELRRASSNAVVLDGKGRWVTPGFIDCHTHLVYAGNRAGEFEQRLAGATYEEIARAGGGIVSTVRATRAASPAELARQSGPRLSRLLAEGVTTVEIKSGYGLDLDNELKLLRVARSLGATHEVDVRTTLLAAHALPPEFRGRADEYVALVCDEIIPAAAREGLADAVDAYCERIAFSAAQVRRVFEAAQRSGLPVKLHADQLSDAGGAALAAQSHALSADHLEHASAEGIAAMARAGTVAVLLPGAYYFLREREPPPIAALRAAGVPIALASDCNPGTSPVTSLLLMLNMACTLFGLTPEETLAGVTRNAAQALGSSDRGCLEPGARADLALWDVDHPRELAYAVGANPLVGLVRRGAVVRWP
jgi:imidazolonepropionase